MRVKIRISILIWIALALAGCQPARPTAVNRPPANRPLPTAPPTSGAAPATEAPADGPSAPDNDPDFGSGERFRGVVNWFNPRKGYGFIGTDDGDLFVHYSGIAGEGYRVLEEGQQVEYSIEVGQKGPEAIDVVVLGGEAPLSTPVVHDFEEKSRFTGSVKWFNPQKGYGFIESDGGDYFVHYTGIAGDGVRHLEEGQQVEFSVEESAKGPAAVDVVVVEP